MIPGIHLAIAWTLILANAIAGLWALAAQRWPGMRHRGLWALIVLAQATTLLSAISGVLLIEVEGRPLSDFHALYGFSTIFAVAILYGYRRSAFIGDRVYLLYGLGSLFIMGLGIRNLVL